MAVHVLCTHSCLSPGRLADEGTDSLMRGCDGGKGGQDRLPSVLEPFVNAHLAGTVFSSRVGRLVPAAQDAQHSLRNKQYAAGICHACMLTYVFYAR